MAFEAGSPEGRADGNAWGARSRLPLACNPHSIVLASAVVLPQICLRKEVAIAAVACGRSVMHIEPGIVDGARIALGYATGAASLGLSLRMARRVVAREGVVPFVVRSVIATALVFFFFEILPHHPVGISEVHLILGSTLFLLFGAGPAALGLAAGLLIQGLFFAPFDLPQYGMNVTTLLVPLAGVALLARRIIAPDTAYADLDYRQVLALSATYQGGIVAWVAFWAFYGQGLTVENLAAVGTFAAAYTTVLLVEPFLDLAVLAGAKAMSGRSVFILQRRLFRAV